MSSNPDGFTFAELLRQYCARERVTQTELARHLTVSRTTVSNWLTGAYRPQRREDVLTIAEMLALSEPETARLLRAAGHAADSPSVDDPEPTVVFESLISESNRHGLTFTTFNNSSRLYIINGIKVIPGIFYTVTHKPIIGILKHPNLSKPPEIPLLVGGASIIRTKLIVNVDTISQSHETALSDDLAQSNQSECMVQYELTEDNKIKLMNISDAVIHLHPNDAHSFTIEFNYNSERYNGFIGLFSVEISFLSNDNTHHTITMDHSIEIAKSPYLQSIFINTHSTHMLPYIADLLQNNGGNHDTVFINALRPMAEEDFSDVLLNKLSEWSLTADISKDTYNKYLETFLLISNSYGNNMKSSNLWLNSLTNVLVLQQGSINPTCAALLQQLYRSDYPYLYRLAAGRLLAGLPVSPGGSAVSQENSLSGQYDDPHYISLNDLRDFCGVILSSNEPYNDDRVKWGKAEAIETLLDFGRDEDIDRLVRITNSSSDYRISAVKALERISGKKLYWTPHTWAEWCRQNNVVPELMATIIPLILIGLLVGIIWLIYALTQSDSTGVDIFIRVVSTLSIMTLLVLVPITIQLVINKEIASAWWKTTRAVDTWYRSTRTGTLHSESGISDRRSFEVRITIRAPLEKVFDLFADPSMLAEVAGSRGVTRLRRTPIGVGTQWTTKHGPLMSTRYEITIFDRPNIITKVLTGSIRGIVTDEFRWLNGATQVRRVFLSERLPLMATLDIIRSQQEQFLNRISEYLEREHMMGHGA